jgi:hypothetical protein
VRACARCGFSLPVAGALACASVLLQARLPILKYVHLESRVVLTVNHVFEIMLRFNHSKDWREAFYHVIPNRKGITELDEPGGGKPGAAGDDGGEEATDGDGTDGGAEKPAVVYANGTGSHGDAEKPCFRFQATGACNFGDKCRYAHPAVPESEAVEGAALRADEQHSSGKEELL